MSTMTSSEREKLLAEGLQIVRHGQDLLLGAGGRSGVESTDLKARAAKALADLNEATVRFSPVVDVREVDQTRPGYRTWHVRIPVTLMSRSGWHFSRVRCSVNFDPGGGDHAAAVVGDMFPHDRWTEMLSLSVQLDLAISPSLEFSPTKTDADTAWNWGPFAGSLEAGARSKVAASSGGLEYSVRMPKIQARGRGNTFSMWRLKGVNVVQEQGDLSFHVLLLVPEHREPPVAAYGAVSAHHNFAPLTAWFGDWWDSFPELLKRLLSRGAPLEDTQEWPQLTPKNS